MKRLLLIISLFLSLIWGCKSQDYIAWQGTAPSGGYGLLYNWPCTQEQANVEYGPLYNWYAATDARAITAAGWRIPTQADFDALVAYLTFGSSGNKLRETGTDHWTSPNTGATNEVGFNARGSGNRNSITNFVNQKNYAYYWVTDMNGSSYVQYVLNYNQAYLGSAYGTAIRNQGVSLRPIKITTSLSNGQTGTYIGNDGKLYNTICIGTQEWLSSNLAETKYRNGDWIHGFDGGVYTPILNSTWNSLTTEAMCYYNNLESNAGSTKKLSSSDEWVVPSYTQANQLTTFIGSSNGGKLKEIGTTHWDSPNEGATNELGFNAIGSGTRGGGDGTFHNLKQWFTFIESTGQNDTYAYGSDLVNTNGIFTDWRSILKKSGYSIRLLYTGSGTPTSYTGNDGTVYPVVLIGTQYWLAQNLKETKWSNGTWIDGFNGGIYTPISNANWVAKVTAACCVYGDDISKK